MEKLPEVDNVRKKVSLQTDVLMLLCEYGYRYVEISEFGTVSFYHHRPVRISWFSVYYLFLSEAVDYYVDFPYSCVVRLFA